MAASTWSSAGRARTCSTATPAVTSSMAATTAGRHPVRRGWRRHLWAPAWAPTGSTAGPERRHRHRRRRHRLGGAGDDYLQVNESARAPSAAPSSTGAHGVDFVDFTYYQFAADVWIDQATSSGFEVRNAEIVRGCPRAAERSTAARPTTPSSRRRRRRTSIDGRRGRRRAEGGGGGHDRLNGGVATTSSLTRAAVPGHHGRRGRDIVDYSLATRVAVDLARWAPRYAFGSVTFVRSRSPHRQRCGRHTHRRSGRRHHDRRGRAQRPALVTAGSDQLEAATATGHHRDGRPDPGAIVVDFAARNRDARRRQRELLRRRRGMWGAAAATPSSRRRRRRDVGRPRATIVSTRRRPRACG